MKLTYKTILPGSLLLALSLASCEKYLTLDNPKDKLETSSVFADSATASKALVGIYSDMTDVIPNFLATETRCAGFAADDLKTNSSSPPIQEFYMNNIRSDNTFLPTMYNELYQDIYQANSIIEGVTASPGISSSEKKILTGEAKFLRAFFFFYLVNNWGDVPLTVTTDYRANETMARTPAAEVYKQIIADLTEAQENLGAGYLTPERCRPNKWAATALLARAYLYTRNWTKAEAEATKVIGAGTYLPLPALSAVFFKTSQETIFQLYPSSNEVDGSNCYDGFFFIPNLTNASIPGYAISSNFYADFETGDNRRSQWIGTKTVSSVAHYFPYKYKVKTGTPATEYNVVLRLAEQYLIRAEARAQLNDVPGAVQDLNIVRARAGLGGLAVSLTQPQAIAAVEAERKHELFCEWGHRWLDLKRTGRADPVLSVVKGSNWQATDTLWPLPIQQLLTNPKLIQNPGY